MKREVISITLNQEQMKKLQEMSEKTHILKSWIIELALEQYFKKNK